VLQRADASPDHDLGVHVERLVRSLRPIEETEHLVPLPARGTDGFAEKVIVTVDPVPVQAGRVRQNALDLDAQLGGHALVRVHDQDPAVGELRNGPVLLRRRIHVFVLENAVRHGVARSTQAGEVRITARRSGASLVVSVVDDGPGIDPGAAPLKNHGLDNTRERLQALYGDRGTLTVVRRDEGGTAGTLRIPYRELPPEVGDAN